MEQNPYIIENRDWLRQRSDVLKVIEMIRYEVQQAQRPAHEVILDDVDLQKLLKVSKRTTANYRAQQLIAHSFMGGKVIYFFSDVLDAIKQNRIPAISEQLKLRA